MIKSAYGSVAASGAEEACGILEESGGEISKGGDC